MALMFLENDDLLFCSEAYLCETLFALLNLLTLDMLLLEVFCP